MTTKNHRSEDGVQMNKQLVARSLKPIVLLSDMPNMATHCSQELCGFSIHRGVLIQWDEDHDERVISVIDNLPINVVDKMYVVQEHEGSIAFMWNGSIPKGYEEGNCIGVPDGDIWSIVSSIALQNQRGQVQS